MKGYERESNLAREIYYSDHYFSYEQLWSFAEQIYYIRQFYPQKMVEVGIGNGFVCGFFRAMGIYVKTFDINPNLKPDVVATVHDIAKFVEPDEFDLISCCEVLEHLPFEDFEEVIRIFSNLSEGLFLTLPVYGRKVGFGGGVQFLRFRRWLGIWLRLPLNKRDLDVHFWEIDYVPQTSKKEILKVLTRYYGKVETGLFKANPSHRYFKCSKGIDGFPPNS